MLNPFPDLLTYSRLAPLIIRVAAGMVFIDLGVLAFRGEKERLASFLAIFKIPRPDIAVKVLGGIEIAGGAMLIAGFYTQVAALVLGLITLIEAYVEYKEPVILKRNLVFYVMLLSMLTSLLFSGAGAFAFDIPL
jgi:uncharacterized membrane protein YphA (DoxX/SURF4 family)